MHELNQHKIAALLPQRRAQSNKGSYGSVAAAAGSLAYRGAAALCVEGALRTGAGLVYLASVEPVIQLVLTRTPECCALPCRTDADGGILAADAAAVRQRFTEKPAVLLAGPGLGPSAARILNALLTADAKWKAAVLDADALNALAAGELGQFPLLPTNTVLTPHPGEAARLLGCSVAQIQTDGPAVAQELAAHGIATYYYNNKKRGELDFVIELGGKVLPIEVKSGKDYETHRALSNIMDCGQYDLSEAVVFNNANLRVAGKIVYAPVYMAMFLEKDDTAPTFYKVDLTGL